MFAGTFLYEPSFVNGLRGFHPYGVSVTASNQKTQQKKTNKIEGHVERRTTDDCSSALAAPRRRVSITQKKAKVPYSTILEDLLQPVS